MEKKEKKVVAPGENSAQDLLRQLRLRYEEDDPEEVFDPVDHPEDDPDGDDEPDDDIARRIMEMFSAVEKQETPQAEPEEESLGEEASLLPTDEAEEIEVEVDDSDEDEIDVEQSVTPEPSLPEEDPDEDELADEPDTEEPLPDDFDGEISAAALSDPDEDGEDAAEAEVTVVEPQEDEPVTLPEQPEPESSEPMDATPDTEPVAMDEEEAPKTVEQSPAVDTTGEETQDVEQNEQAPTHNPKNPPADEAAEEAQAPVPVLSPAALPLSEGEEAAKPVRTAQEDEESSLAEEPSQTAAQDIVLAEDEVLLDEYDELPAKEEPQTPPEEPSPAPQPLQPEPKKVTPRPSPLDAALSEQRKKHEAQVARHSNVQSAAETLSEEDVALLLRLGYENELSAKQSSEAIHRVRQDMACGELTDRQRFRMAYGWRECERGDTLKDTQIKEIYRKNAIGVAWRMAITLIVALACLAWDLSPLYAHLLPLRWAEQATHPSAHLLALQLLVLCALPSGRKLFYGLRQLLHLTPEPCSVVLPLFLCNVGYDLIMALQSQYYVLLNFPTALMLLLLVGCDAMDLRRERIAFSVVSSSENKTVLLDTQPRKKKVVRGNRIVKIINDDADRKHYSVERAERPDGYFRRTNEPTVRYRAILPLLGLQMLLSLSVCGICTLQTGVTPAALSVLLLAMQLTAPAACLLSYAYALLLACRRLQAKGATIIGQSTVDEMGKDKTLIFADTEMLQAKSSTEISIKGGGDPRRYVRYARRLFYALGGTLSKINTSDLSEDRMDGLVEILRVYPDGVEARIDGRVRVLAGSSAFLSGNGIRVPATGAELLAKRNDESCILYLAFGGQIRLGYEINYRILGSFEQMAAVLANGSTAVAICSYDPCVTDAYLAAGRAKRKVPVRVIKPVRHQARTVRDRVDSGIVATGHVRAVAWAIRMCERILKNDRSIRRVQWTTAFLGAAAAAALCFGVLMDATVSIIAALLMGIFMLPVWMLAGKDLWPEADTAPKTPRPSGERDSSQSESTKSK